jgi:hypothetical protein
MPHAQSTASAPVTRGDDEGRGEPALGQRWNVSAAVATPSGWDIWRMPIASPRRCTGNQPITTRPLAAFVLADAAPRTRGAHRERVSVAARCGGREREHGGEDEPAGDDLPFAVPGR